MKQITNAELAMIVTRLLSMDSDDLPGEEDMAHFMTELTELVCRHCGGEIRTGADNAVGTWMITVHGNDSVPPDGGVWAQFDPDSPLFDTPVVECDEEASYYAELERGYAQDRI